MLVRSSAILDASDCANLFLVNGCSAHGVMHARALGQLLSVIMSDGSASVDISPLWPSRFREGDLNPFSEML